MFAKDQEITTDAVVKKLSEIVAMRGKKGTDRSMMIDLLRELKVCETLQWFCLFFFVFFVSTL